MISPDDSDPALPHLAMVTATMQYRPAWRNTLDGTPLGGPTDTAVVRNTVVLAADDATTGDPLTTVQAHHDLEIRDGIQARVDII